MKYDQYNCPSHVTKTRHIAYASRQYRSRLCLHCKRASDRLRNANCLTGHFLGLRLAGSPIKSQFSLLWGWIFLFVHGIIIITITITIIIYLLNIAPFNIKVIKSVLHELKHHHLDLNIYVEWKPHQPSMVFRYVL